ncbi:MAG: BTAD domain-containing putative transcriptional regulator [Deinococcota bacterium]
MNQLELTLLGTPEVRFGSDVLELQNRHIALLSFILIQKRPCSRDELITMLWGTGKKSSLRTALYKLRHYPGADLWLQGDDPITLVATSDVTVLETMQETEVLSDAALAVLERIQSDGTSNLLHGIAAPTPAYASWLEEQHNHITALVDELLLTAASELHISGRFAKAEVLLTQLIARDPLREAAYRLLMQVEADSGKPGDAQQTFERLRATLREQLDSEPSQETLNLRRNLLGSGSGVRAVCLQMGERIPAQASQLFGREGLLEHIHEHLQENAILLHGFGGVGKTALAAEVGGHYLQQGNVLWLSAGFGNATDVLNAFSQTLQVSGLLTVENAHEALAREEISLVIVDDVWSESTLNRLREHLPEDLPLLVTARQRFKGLDRIDVSVLAREDAKALLAFAAERDADELASSDTLCAIVGDHPFALRIAGAKLKNDALTPKQLVAQLADSPHQLKTPKGWREAGKESISALLQTSLDTLSDDAYEAFMAIGALESGSVSSALLTRLLRRDVDKVDGALIELQTRALAERSARPGSDVSEYHLHDLAHSFAKANNILRPRTVVVACCNLVKDDPKAFDVFDVEIPNIIAALEHAAEQEDKETLTHTMADLAIKDTYFGSRGHTPRSLVLLETALNWAKDLGWLDEAHYFAGRVGDAYRVQYHDYVKALKAYTESTKLARLLHDSAREAVLTCMCGITNYHLGKDPSADFEHAQGLAEESGNKHAIGHVLQNRSYVAGLEEDWAAQAHFGKKAVKLARDMLVNQTLNVSRAYALLYSSLINVGEALRKLGEFEQAVTYREEALAIAVLRNNELWQAKTHLELGEMYLDNDQHILALNHLNQSLGFYKRNNATAKTQEVQFLLEALSSRRVDA